MRVFFLIDMIDDEICGGAERFATALAIDLARQGFDVSLCATRYLDVRYRSRLAAAGVWTTTLNRRGKWDIHRLWRLRRILIDRRPHILHTHKFGSNAWGTLFGRIAGVPVIIAHEHTWSYQGGVVRRLVDGEFVGRFADRFIAVSEDDAHRMVSYEKVPASKIAVFPTASDSGEKASEPWSVRTEIGVSEETKIVSVAAMMRPQKALDVMIQAMAIVVDSRTDIHLVVVGDGQCRHSLETLTSELGVTNYVHFMGIRGNVVGLLAESDCSALSSDYEGMPLFVIESLTAGTPIVATDVGAVSQLVRNGDTGYLVPPRDPQRMADAILRVLADPLTHGHMRESCRSLAQNYTIESVAGQFGELYSKLASERGLRP